MKTIMALIALGLIPSALTASDRDSPNSASVRQQPKSGVDGLRVGIPRLKPGMRREEIIHTLGDGSFLCPAWIYGFGVSSATGFPSEFQQFYRFQGGYKLDLRFKLVGSVLRLTSASLSCDKKIIAKMKK